MEKLSLKNRYEKNIYGDLYRAENPAGTFILIHGYMDTKESPQFISFKDACTKNHYNVFIFDASNSIGQSDGHNNDSKISLHHHDLEDVCQWGMEQEWFTGPLCVAGHSMGGHVAAKYAEENKDTVERAILIAPMISGKSAYEGFKERHPEGYDILQKEGSFKYTNDRGMEVIYNKSSLEDIKEFDLYDGIENLNMPCLFIVGQDDYATPPKGIKEFFEKIPNKNSKSEYVEVPGVRHNFNKPEQGEKLRGIIDKWLGR